jgi:hypothetical protein
MNLPKPLLGLVDRITIRNRGAKGMHWRLSPIRATRETLLLLVLLLPAVMQAQFTFTSNNGALTITGYTGSGGNITIPSATNGMPVTSIGCSAFLFSTNLTGITIPNSVTNIDFQAFTKSGLTNLVLPDSVIDIAQSAFLDCTSLAGLTIGNGVVSIGEDAFYACTSLTNVFVPKSVTNLTSTAFYGCSNLVAINVDTNNPAYTSVAGVVFNKNQTRLVDFPGGISGSYTIPSSVTAIGDFAFPSCNLTNLVFPDSVVAIGQYAFYGCTSMNTVTLPTDLVTIGQYAFASSGLTNLTLPGRIASIGGNAFAEIALTSTLIPASVTNIGPAAFSYCFGLTSINVEAGSSSYSSVAGVLFDLHQTALIAFPAGLSGSFLRPASYAIPNGVTSIADGAFTGCFLGNVTIPDSVASIGSDAFNGCRYLTNLMIPNSVTNIGDGAFASTRLTHLVIPASVTNLGWLGYVPTLHAIYFLGNAPGASAGGIPPALFPINATAYYLPGTTGWGTYFQVYSIVTIPWLPQARSDASFGVRTNVFGFNINWADGQTVVVEASTELANPLWIPVSTNTLTGGTSYFSDPLWTNYPSRFYRIRSP